MNSTLLFQFKADLIKMLLVSLRNCQIQLNNNKKADIRHLLQFSCSICIFITQDITQRNKMHGFLTILEFKREFAVILLTQQHEVDFKRIV